MSANPFVRKVLGEAEEPMPPTDDLEQDALAPEDDEAAAPEPAPVEISEPGAPEIPAQELARMWQAGQEMDVATQLMFTPASYVDFVDLCFIIGQGDGRRLGQMLDELADSENVPVPEPSDDYSSILQRISANREHGTMVPTA